MTSPYVALPGQKQRCNELIRTRHFYKPGFLEQSRKKPIPQDNGCRLAGKASLVCHFRSPACGFHEGRSAHRFALRLPSDDPSRERPCFRLVFMFLSSRQCRGSDTGDFYPIESRPCRAYTRGWSGRENAALVFSESYGTHPLPLSLAIN